MPLTFKELKIEDPHLGEDARKAHETGLAAMRQVFDADGCVYDRRVEPYKSDIGGVIVTYKPAVSPTPPTQDKNDPATKEVVGTLAMGMQQIGVWTVETSSSHMDWDERFGAITGLGRPGASSDDARFPNCIFEDDREIFARSLQAVIDSSQPLDFELRFCPPGEPMIWLQMRGLRVDGADGPMIVGIIADISERKNSAQRSDFMMRELDHRVKNLLAIILSIAEITGRSNTDIETYKNDFRARLESMARTHNLLAQTNWTGLDLRTLVEEETYSLAPKPMVAIDGPALKITPAAAQSLAMFLHELIVNALKHGSLASDTGHLAVNWEFWAGPAETLRLTWSETGAGEVVEPAREGFGGKVINRIVKRQLDAQVTTDWHAGGMQLTADIPLANIVATQ